MKKKQQPETRGRKRVRSLGPGLRLAVDAVGGNMSELARGLGITPQSLSEWDTIPIHHLLAVEKLTGIDRARLRPDIFRRR